MKVKVFVERVEEIEVEVDDKIFAPLDIALDAPTPPQPFYDRATKEIERVVGLPFGNDDLNNPAFIVGVHSVQSGNTMMEW